MPTAADQAIEYCGVWITAEEMAEVEHGRAMLTVPRAGLESVTLRWGWRSERPLALFGCGTILTALGLLPVPFLIRWILQGGTISRTFTLLLVWLPFGGWAIYRAAGRGFYLAIETREGSRKLAFSRKAEPADIEAFLKEAEARFGYSFRRED